VIGLTVITDFYEPKSPRFSGKPVSHYVDAVHGHTGLRKEILYVALGGRIGKIPHK
jgi:hypothetical protein